VNFPLPVEVISSILGPYGPIDNVRANWPLVEAALDRHGVFSNLTAVAAIATIAVESGTFGAAKEKGGPTYLTNVYESRKDLGNDQPGDGVKFRGRGFIPIVGRREYEHFGAEIGRDLVADPDIALDPAIAAELLAIYFKQRDVRVHADQQNWEMVRRRVDRHFGGWPRFIDVVTKLVSALKNPLPADAFGGSGGDRV
jgi:putative chitinase